VVWAAMEVLMAAAAAAAVLYGTIIQIQYLLLPVAVVVLVLMKMHLMAKRLIRLQQPLRLQHAMQVILAVQAELEEMEDRQVQIVTMVRAVAEPDGFQMVVLLLQVRTPIQDMVFIRKMLFTPEMVEVHRVIIRELEVMVVVLVAVLTAAVAAVAIMAAAVVREPVVLLEKALAVAVHFLIIRLLHLLLRVRQEAMDR